MGACRGGQFQVHGGHRVFLHLGQANALGLSGVQPVPSLLPIPTRPNHSRVLSSPNERGDSVMFVYDGEALSAEAFGVSGPDATMRAWPRY
jgi:hypothetical protein